MGTFVTIEVDDDVTEREDFIEYLTSRFADALTDLVHQIEDQRKQPSLIHL